MAVNRWLTLHLEEMTLMTVLMKMKGHLMKGPGATNIRNRRGIRVDLRSDRVRRAPHREWMRRGFSAWRQGSTRLGQYPIEINMTEMLTTRFGERLSSLMHTPRHVLLRLHIVGKVRFFIAV